MTNLSSFSSWSIALGCLLTLANCGCGDSSGGRIRDRSSDGGIALDGGGRKDGRTALDTVQDGHGRESGVEAIDGGRHVDADGVKQGQAGGDAHGDTLGGDVDFSADGVKQGQAGGDAHGDALGGDADISADGVKQGQAGGGAHGDALGGDADIAADADDANQGLDGAGPALPPDEPSGPVDAEPQIDAMGASGDDAPVGAGSRGDVDVAFDASGVEGGDTRVGPDDGGGDGGRFDHDGGETLNHPDGSAEIDGGLDSDGGMDAGGSAHADAPDEIDAANLFDASDANDASDKIDGNSGYTVQSEYLLNPDLAKGMLKSLADFRVRALDTVNGGSFTYTNVDGTVSNDHRKSFVTQTRDAWAFSRAFMVTGDEAYLDHAAQELDFLYAHGWDSTNGGWYFISDERGNLTDLWPGYSPNTYKGCFIQHYALLGIGALCDATRDQDTCAWLQKGRGFLDEKMWDSNPSQLGYYDYGSLDLATRHSKSFTSTVDAMTTHAIQSALLWPGNQAYQQRLQDLANIVADRLAANIDLPSAMFGFPENYNTDWTVDASQTVGYVGHVLKSAWVLARAYLLHPDARYRQAARKLIHEVLNNGGWDEAHGVPYTTTNWSTGAQDTTQTECWQIQQAIMSGLANWYIAENPTDKDTYLRMADRSLLFFVAHVVDPVQGGTWKMNYVNGSPKGNSKSNEYNVEYHSTETFYFTYLYGNLMLHGRPVTLYYRVSPSPDQQVIQLNPVAIDDASLQIQSVTLNGAPFSGFSRGTREVTMAANQGGKLAVTFGRGP